MQTNRTWLALLAAVAIVAIAMIAVAGGSDHKTTGNATDAAFITDMTAHHEGAIAMAGLARTRAEHPEIKQLADGVVSAQEGEISVMKTIRADMHHMGEHGSGHMGMSDHAMGMDMDMTALENAKPFDKAFIDAMVPHHQGAITMAKELLENGEQPALRRMANDIISAQTKEIAQMREWRKAWYGSEMGSGDMEGHDGSRGSMDMGG